MHEKMHIIYNPTADHGNALKHTEQVEALLDRNGLHYKMELTQSSGHAIILAREAALRFVEEGRDQDGALGTIVAAGGDGTVNEVINGLMQAREQLRGKSGGDDFPSFGVIPVGRGNDFAYGAGVPHNMEESCRLLKEAAAYEMDIGCVSGGYYPEGRYFGNGIGIGFDTLVGLEAAKVTWIPGFLGYVYGALKMLIVYPAAPKVNMEFDSEGRESLGTFTPQISVMNGRRMGGTFYMAPRSINHDGEFDLCIARGSLKRSQLLTAMTQYTKGSQERNPHIYTRRSRFVRIEAVEGSLACHADGETICTEGRELTVECMPRALRFHGIPLES